uniref:L1 transposable element RRM domain-containing protein n=1 Tax=Esox lucius TaxID=8010 RepID=A0AAY5KS41_ESOLU
FDIYLIMNTSPSKEARKRENEQSPMKKKFKDSAISKEELDAAIANGIKLALQEQQRDQLTTKLTDLEDRGRRNNVRLVGLPETVEGSDAVGYLKVNLPKWIPSLVGRDIDIERAHRVYDGGEAKSNKPRTLIFRLLRWQDRSAILNGARQVYPVKHTAISRKSFSSTMKKARDMGLEPFLIYPARLKLQYYGEKKLFDSGHRRFSQLSSAEVHLNTGTGPHHKV